MKRLTRSTNNKMIAGVCGGLAEYFNIDPTIMRILYVVLALISDISFILIYIICTIVIPEDDGVIYHDKPNYSKDNTTWFIGVGLIIIGGILLGRVILTSFNFAIIHSINRFLRRAKDFWPVLLIILGIFILINQKNKE